ncbi:WG repeat-containing protein, partial [Bacteroidota bacterium]
MKGRILISSFAILLFPVFINPYFLSAQVIDSGTNKSTKSKTEMTNMNKLDFGFCVPDSSIIADVTFIDGIGFVASDKSGNELYVIFPFDNGPDYISEGMFRIVDGDKIGFASELGEIVIKPRFGAVYPFHNGLAAFCEGCVTVTEGEHKMWVKGKWGFINRKGEVVIPPEFDRIISDFRNGNAIVEKEGIELTIDKEGKQIEVKGNNKEITKPEELFPDYHPKNSPDTVLDYMPSIAGQLAKIPEAKITNLSSLVILFNKYHKEAEAHPGRWEEGNIVLGAREREYRPSEAELLLCEVGERLQSLNNDQPKDKFKQVKGNENITFDADEYLKFTFIHIDVMG